MLNIFVLPVPKGAEEMQKDPDPDLKPLRPSSRSELEIT